MKGSAVVRIYLPLILLGGACLWAYVRLFTPFVYPFSSADSSAYLEATHYFVVGEGLVHTASLGNVNSELQPLGMWPPGYPLLAAGFAAMGFSDRDAVLLVSRLATVFLPAALVFCLSPLAGVRMALLCGLLAVFSPLVLSYGYAALSDIPFVLLTSLSLGVLFRAVSVKQINPGLFLLSGLLGGAAYAMRNAGLALLAGVAAAFVLALLLRIMAIDRVARSIAFWGAGVFVVLAPMWIRNIAVFGKLDTYALPVTKVDVTNVLRSYLESLLYDLSGSKAVALNLAWNSKLLAAVGIPAVLVAVLALYRQWKKSDVPGRFGMMVLLLYFLAGSGMVVIAGSLWLQGVSTRLVIPYSFVVFGILAVALGGDRILDTRSGRIAIAASVALLVLARAGFFFETYQLERAIGVAFGSGENLAASAQSLPDRSAILTKQIDRVLASDNDLMTQVRDLPQRALVVSNRAHILRIETGRSVRAIELSDFSSEEPLRFALPQIAKAARSRPFYLYLLVDNRMVRRALEGDWQSRLIAELPAGFVVKERHPNWLVITFNPPSAA